MTQGAHKILTHVGYGFAELGVSAIESFLRLYLLIYLTSTIGLSADLAGYAVSIGILWDAFADPIMGKISDKTRTKWGRRLPWIFAGTPILALAFVFIFFLTPIANPNHPWAIFWEVTLLNILLNTAMSMVSVPHLALGNELQGDTTQNRTAIYAWRSAMTLFGFLVGILVPAVLNASGIKLTRPELTFAGIIAVICLFATAVTLFSCRERSVDPTTIYPENSVKIRDLLRGKVGKLMLAFFIATFAQGLNSVLAMYYYRFTLALDDQAIGKILIVFVLTLCATIPFWVSGAKRVSKTTLIGYGTAALGIISSIAYPMFPAGQLNGPYLMAVVGGCLLGSSGLLESLLVDTAEDQKIEAGTLGVVFGLWKFMAKAARGIAIAFGGKLLAIIGYTPTSTPDSAVLVNIAWLFGPGVGVFFLLTGILLVFEKNKNSRV